MRLDNCELVDGDSITIGSASVIIRACDPAKPCRIENCEWSLNGTLKPIDPGRNIVIVNCYFETKGAE